VVATGEGVLLIQPVSRAREDGTRRRQARDYRRRTGGVRGAIEWGRVALLAGLLLLASSPSAHGAEAAAPSRPFDVPTPTLAASLECSPIRHPEHEAVLLVHGTSVTADENWAWNYELALPAAGFDWCTVQIPDYELEDVQLSAEYAVYAIRQVAQRSGHKIGVVGLSQGPLEPRWALRWWPDTRQLVSRFISMAGTNHGAAFGDADCVYECPPAIWQQTHYRQSNFLRALNTPRETQPGIAYTSVYSLTDDIIQPAAPDPTAAIAGAANIAVQDICPGRYVGHVQSAWDAAYYAVVIDALTHAGPADPARVDRSYCNQQAMPKVDPVTGWENTANVYLVAGQRQTPYPKTTSEPPLRDYVTSGALPPGYVDPAAARNVADSGAAPSGTVRATAGGLRALPDTVATATCCGLAITLRRRRRRSARVR